MKNSLNEVSAFFENAKMFFLATVEDDQPRVRPFGHLAEHEGRLYFNTGKHKNVYKQLCKDPKIEICAFDKGVWYRVDAIVKESEEDAIKQMMIEIDPVVKKTYGSSTEDLAIFTLTHVKAYQCTFASNELVYEE